MGASVGPCKVAGKKKRAFSTSKAGLKDLCRFAMIRDRAIK